MVEKLKILFLSAEVAPFAKTGGLGDVGGSLPKALKRMGHDVRVVMPAYRKIERGYPGVEPMDLLLNVPTGDGLIPAGVFQGTIPGSEVPVYFIAQWNLFDRPDIYGYWDDPYRFAFYSRAALDLMVAALDWRPDVVHAHDWHAAPAVFWLATAGWHDERYANIPTIFTIHNLAHQGRSKWEVINYLGIQHHSLAEEGYGEINFMARGIYHATLLNTVSPTYANEIRTPAGGAYLDGLLRHRGNDLRGILNGLDYTEWDPAGDERIAAQFDAETLEMRRYNRHALQNLAGLPQADYIPLVAMISRLDYQKGLDITGHVIHLLMSGYAGEAQFVVLGTGAGEYEEMFARLARQHPQKMTAVLEFNAALAPLIYAGSDMFIMPSRFEPCGLGQLIAMHYGSVPVVKETGGLADTVQDSVTGFTFRQHTAEDFWQAMQRAIYVYNVHKEQWRDIQLNGMAADFSWERSAKDYLDLYREAIARHQ